MIPNNITKQDIISAILEIEEKGVREGRHSSTYDLLYEGKAYPPKLVISIANRYRNGVELDSQEFAGGKDTPAFELLKKEGFEIVEKGKSKDYTIVNEYISELKSEEIKAADSIKKLVANNNFKERLSQVDYIFFNNRLKEINSTNYLETIELIKEIHSINGEYNDFNIWSASKNQLLKTNPELIQRHQELNKKLGFSDNQNGIYKSFLGEKNFLPFLKNKFNKEESSKKYWLYSPGESARKWDELYSTGEMAIGWGSIGNLSFFKSKEEIEKALLKDSDSGKRKYNDALACYEFACMLNPGDIVIVKKGKSDYVGWGIVEGEYYYDTSKDEYSNRRKVNWVEKGEWSEENGDIVTKTLTDITKYPDYVKRLIKLIGIDEKWNLNKTESLKMELSLNTILYGPPGTGKTYNTILRAAEIVENRKIDTYQEALKIFKENLHNRIEFITFHQNYSYEDFIQGLRPETDNKSALTFDKKDGVFKKIADKALENLKLSKKAPEELTNEALFDIALEKFKEVVEENNVSFSINETAYIMEVEEDAFRYTGEKWTNHTNGLRMKFSDLKEFYKNGVKSRKDVKKLSNISGLAGQHATYYYLVYENIIKLLPVQIDTPIKIERKNFVIVIDEINRANISRVFGELITLIEPDKRSDGEIPLEVKLPSGDLFSVPSNLFIIGTMNTADKSIALLDIALRRRFEFESMYPLYEIKGSEIYDKDILLKINEQIIKSKGHDFQIGHAYFMGENKDLTQRMNKKVIPLLLEYLMNDEKEVKAILFNAGLQVEENSWPIKITGKRA